MRATTNEYTHFIEIVPAGEEQLHVSGFACECAPAVTIPHRDAKPVITHLPLNKKVVKMPVAKDYRRAA